MMYNIKLQHLGHTFEMLMEAPSKGEIIRRIQSLKAPVETKIVHIKEQDHLHHKPDAG